MNTKCGFVAIIGEPNAGKSTLLNVILGTKLSIVTPKPQTTRKNVIGIYTKENVQIIFIDTPGIITPNYELQASMMKNVDESLSGTDIITVITDVSKISKKFDKFEKLILKKIQPINQPKIALLNKIDLLKDIKQTLPIIDKIEKYKIFDDIIPVSAVYASNIDRYIETLIKYLPENPFMYEPELLSTENERFFVSEIIREVLFNELKEEVPYSTEVMINSFKERENGKWFISADIIVERDSQKVIILGAKGFKLKKIGIKARAAIEAHLGKEIFLKLFVKVRPKWRNNKSFLKSLGYK